MHLLDARGAYAATSALGAVASTICADAKPAGSAPRIDAATTARAVDHRERQGDPRDAIARCYAGTRVPRHVARSRSMPARHRSRPCRDLNHPPPNRTAPLSNPRRRRLRHALRLKMASRVARRWPPARQFLSRGDEFISGLGLRKAGTGALGRWTRLWFRAGERRKSRRRASPAPAAPSFPGVTGATQFFHF
jgi:hypothetical protein